MEQLIAEQKARELQIDRTQVVREYWELILLKGLYDSPFGRNIIFKGGTALRLAYDSPRFSEDLDISLTHDALKGNFSALVKKIIVPFSELVLTDLEEKYHTYLAEIKVTESYLPFPFRVKIEISKRKIKNYGWRLHLLTSPVTTVSVLGQVGTLEQIYQDKLSCLKGRAKPKDFFDLWYIAQKLKIPYVPSKTAIKKTEVARELRKYLPKDFWPAIDELTT
ncbi:MAG: nucleotidyl transferase AbiEii/AbiGii toxin family protein [Candidatus Cloacimonetes bacterium]|nr:nucleotidyl transferase AbiEii/AbiGii toxin family protein [Candidatus Cloacimonadota bacterium]